MQLSQAKPGGGANAAPRARGTAVVYQMFDRRTPHDMKEAFNRWLDARLRAMYRATQNEPLPQEMLDLVQRMLRSAAH